MYGNEKDKQGKNTHEEQDHAAKVIAFTSPNKFLNLCRPGQEEWDLCY